jgi:hypothetical protein
LFRKIRKYFDDIKIVGSDFEPLKADFDIAQCENFMEFYVKDE